MAHSCAVPVLDYHKCGYRVEEPLSVDEALHAVGAAEEVLAQVVNCNCNFLNW